MVLVCNFCGKPGHFYRECRKRQYQTSQNNFLHDNRPHFQQKLHKRPNNVNNFVYGDSNNSFQNFNGRYNTLRKEFNQYYHRNSNDNDRNNKQFVQYGQNRQNQKQD